MGCDSRGDSDDEQFHSRFTSEKSTNSSSSMVIYDSLSFNKCEDEKFDNLSSKKRKRLNFLMSDDINNNSLNNGCISRNHNNFNESSKNFVPQDFVLNNNRIVFCDNSSNRSEEKNFFFSKSLPPNDISPFELLPNDSIPETDFSLEIDMEEENFADIPSYIRSISLKLKEIIIGNYSNLNPGSLSLSPSTNSICIELQANNNLDRIDFHVKGIQNYNRKNHNFIQLNLVHDWIKYLLPVREVSSTEEIKIKIDPTEGELRRTGCIKLFLENSVSTRDVNIFRQEFRKMKDASKPPILSILKWEETKFEVIINYNRHQRCLFVMKETTLQEFLLIVRKKFNSSRINLPFRYLLDEPEIVHILSEENWKIFKLASFYRQNQDFERKKILVLYIKDNID